MCASNGIVHFKPQVQSASIIHDGNSQAYNTLRSNFLAANADEKPSFLEMIKDFVQHEMLENIASNIHKGFASYTIVDVGPLLFLNIEEFTLWTKTDVKQSKHNQES